VAILESRGDRLPGSLPDDPIRGVAIARAGRSRAIPLSPKRKQGSSSAPRRMRSPAGSIAADQTQPREVALDPLLDDARSGSASVDAVLTVLVLAASQR
jgi:hypothetical protein